MKIGRGQDRFGGQQHGALTRHDMIWQSGNWQVRLWRILSIVGLANYPLVRSLSPGVPFGESARQCS